MPLPRVKDTPPASGFAASAALLIGLAVMSLLYAPQPLLALIAEETGRSATEANLVLSAATFGIALGVFPMAWLAARVGRWRTILGALAIGAVCTVGTALSEPWWGIIGSRVAVGFAIAAVLVSVLTWVREVVPPAVAPHVSALYVAGTSLGGMFGRVFAGFVAEALGWRLALIVTDAVVLVFAIIAVVFVARHARRRFVVAEASTTRSGAAVRTLPVFVLIVIGFLSTTMYVGVFSAISFRMLAPPFDLGVAAASLLFLCYGAGTIAASRTGALLQRLGLRAVVLIGTAVTFGSIVLSLIDSLVSVIIALSLLSAGFFIIHTASTTSLVAVARRPTTATAWYTLWYYAGASVGALLSGAAWDLGRWTLVAIVSAAPLLVIVVMSLLLPARIDDGSAPDDSGTPSTSSPDPVPNPTKE